jgi:acetyl esterase/lipase
LNTNVWGNATISALIHDAQKAVRILTVQPEVDPKRISIIGHSEGTIIAPWVAINNSTMLKNIILMGTVAQSTRGLLHHQIVDLRSEYATQILDKNHTGLISIQQVANTPVLRNVLVPSSVLFTGNTKLITNALVNKFGNTTPKPSYISIGKQLKPSLVKAFENLTTFNPSKCYNIGACPIWQRSELNMIPTLSIIGNVSKSTGILILNGENDSQTPVQQAFILQQKLTDVNHPDHTLITYPNLGHSFYPSSQWSTGIGPIEPYVLADIYAWLEAHSGISHPYIATPTSTLGPNANTSSSSIR